MVRYYGSEAKAADYDTWFFRIDSTGGWALTPTLTMLPSVYYLNTTNSSGRTQQVPSGDPVLPPVTITNYGNTNTEDFGGAVNFNYLATPNLTIGVNGNYSEQRFSAGTDNTAGSGLTNSKQTGGNASVSYLFSPRTSLGILVAGNHQTYENAPDSNTLSGGILFGYQFSAAFRLDGRLRNVVYPAKRGPGDPGTTDILSVGIIQCRIHLRDVHSQRFRICTCIPVGAATGRPPGSGPLDLLLTTSSPESGSGISPGPIRSAGRCSLRMR